MHFLNMVFINIRVNFVCFRKLFMMKLMMMKLYMNEKKKVNFFNLTQAWILFLWISMKCLISAMFFGWLHRYAILLIRFIIRFIPNNLFCSYLRMLIFSVVYYTKYLKCNEIWMYFYIANLTRYLNMSLGENKYNLYL